MLNGKNSWHANRETSELPPSLICDRTGLAAGLTDCTCDACLWVRALEEDFAEKEAEPDGEDHLR